MKDFYPDIRIILLNMPVSCWANKAQVCRLNDWKGEFYNILDDLKQKYDFEYYDLRELEMIDKNPYFWFDPGHLNGIGATAFSSYLDELLFGCEHD